MDESTRPAQPPDGRVRRKDAERNRSALIAAGSELFDAAGLMPTLDDVARRAGVGVGTAYRHFPNKYALAQAVFAETVETMLKAAERAATMADAADGLAAFFEAVLEPQANKRALGKLLRGAPTEDSGADDVRARVERCIDHLLQRGREQQAIRADVTTTDIGVLMSLMAHLIETFGEANPRLWRRLLPILLDGLRADAPTSLPEQPLSTSAFLSRLAAG
ncbi:helix-turn-helix domain containing protein [Micromonospora sp. WMMD961]|uniref:TetR/AcrR family transcriptional regulator n=1 Tax=Micromonospora sp. WMMD961 TaxID=3016100 RepID=UPI0024176074|nr:TetR/AcrR family transcriptional regulator [Micromonospora sp. WMMD961]MDG4780741.1 helix-turn-helix domain containing protein [Micromonospora sp. WMMD961]